MSRPPGFRVGNVFSVRQAAGPVHIPGKGWFGELIEPGAFDGQIGKTVPIKFRGDVIGHGRLTAAEVADDGSSVLFTYEILDLGPGQTGSTVPG